MGCFWMLLYSANPALLLLGLFGFFGKEAQETASLMLFVEGLAGILFLIGYLIYLLITAIAQHF